MGNSGKPSKLSTIVATICIVAYIAALIFASVRIIINIRERQNYAEREFYDLADRATSSSVFLGFMSDAYQVTIRDFLSSSETLLGIIITGSGGEFAFERYPGSGIVWTGDTPRFKTGIGFPREPFFLPIGIEGQRNVTIQAVYGLFDYYFFQEVLRHTLLLVLSTLIIAFFALLVELAMKKRSNYYQSMTFNIPKTSSEPKVPMEPKDLSEKPPAPIDTGKDKEQANKPVAPLSNIGPEPHTRDRLGSELNNCVSHGQDLALLAIEIREPEKASGFFDESLFNQFTEEAVSFFIVPDQVFGKGKNGISVIMPGTNLEQGIAKAEEFRRRITALIPELSGDRRTASWPSLELCIGLSSRSGRVIEAERLMLEADSALKRVEKDSASHVMAFKSDPEKYREFIKENH